jgi:hypothetical protein
VTNGDLKNEVCNVHNAAAAPGGGDPPPGGEQGPEDPPSDPPQDPPEDPPENPPQVNPPSQSFEVVARGPGGSGTWGIYQRPKGDVVNCNPGEVIFDGPTLPQDMLNLQGKVEIGPFNLPDSYTACNFVANDATQGGDILCNEQPKIPCRRTGQNSICLGNLGSDPSTSTQTIWVCNE